MAGKLKILETFRDAVQGLDYFIPTNKKLELLNELLSVGFDIVDIGSFVSPKVIPQFSDMEEVLNNLEPTGSLSKLFVLTANIKGAQKALPYEQIEYLGFPFSTSETFLRKNIKQNFNESWQTINDIQNLCQKSGKKLIVYLAMAFGNPYNDPVNVDICLDWTSKLASIGVDFIYLSDIIGVSTPAQIGSYYINLTSTFKDISFGFHLHTDGINWYEKIDSAFQNNCSYFDGVISGLGGCPMTGYEMLSNLASSKILSYASKNQLDLNIDEEKFSLVNKSMMSKMSF